MAQACRRKAPVVRLSYFRPVRAATINDEPQQNPSATSQWRSLCPRGVQLLHGLSMLLIWHAISQEKYENLIFAGCCTVGSLAILYICKSGVSPYDWLVEYVPLWLSSIFCIIAPTGFVFGLQRGYSQLVIFALPATIAWITGLHCQLRVQRIKEKNPSPRDFARATKSIRTWTASWLVAFLVLCGAGIYYSVNPEELGGSNTWIICSAVSVAVYSSLAKVLGEAQAEEYEAQSSGIEQLQVVGLIARIKVLHAGTPFLRDLLTYLMMLAALLGFPPR